MSTGADVPQLPIVRRDPDHRDLLRLAIEAAGSTHNFAAMDNDALTTVSYADAANYSDGAPARLRQLAAELRKEPSP